MKVRLALNAPLALDGFHQSILNVSNTYFCVNLREDLANAFWCKWQGITEAGQNQIHLKTIL